MNKLSYKLIQQTQENYNILAPHFAYTRGSIWPDLKIFGSKVKPKAKVLDLGCGNGRIYELLKEKKVDYLGIDFSQRLIGEAKKRYPQAKFKLADITLEKSWRSLRSKYDAVFCIAVLHHLPTEKLRREIVSQIWQALKPGGKTFVTIWNLWQKKYFKHHFSAQSLKLKWQLKDIRALFIPYQYESLIINRFLHAFTLKELICLFREANFKIEKSWSSGKNFCLVATREV